jgi:hypothetical protein
VLPAGFVSQTDADSNPYIYGVTSTAVTPTETTSSSTSYAQGVLIKAMVPNTITAKAVQYHSGTAMTSFTLTGAVAKDLWIGYIEIDPGNTTVKSLTSTNAEWKQLTQATGKDGKDYEIWAGKINASGSDTVTIAFQGTIGTAAVETGFMELVSSRDFPSWTVDSTGFMNNASGTTIPFPYLYSRNQYGLYFGYGKTTAVASAGSTPGYGYSVTPVSNIVTWNTEVFAGQSPSAVTTAGSGNSIAAIVSDTAIAATAYAVLM